MNKSHATSNQHPSARDREEALLQRCLAVARGDTDTPDAVDEREANVFRVTAKLLRHPYDDYAQRLFDASARYFSAHGGTHCDTATVIRNRWIVGLPRWRDLLERELNAKHRRPSVAA